MINKTNNWVICQTIGIQINYDDKKGNRPIHYMVKCQKDIDQIISYFLEDIEGLHSFDSDGLLPIHIVSKNLFDWNIIKPFLDNNINLEVFSEEGMNSLHYVCRYASKECILNFIQLNVDGVLSKFYLYRQIFCHAFLDLLEI